jgi:hypothetical protein
MKKLIPILVALAVAWFYSDNQETFVRSSPAPSSRRPAASAEFVAGSQVRGSGTVVRILADDDNGSRHQRFIIQIQSGRTLLIAHNIDLAPRVAGIRKGDTVEFNGEFEPNPQGGVIHWTHLDPQGSHVAGWLKYNGRMYQ